MKIYILTDLEGATGVYTFAQTRSPGSAAYHEAVRLLMGDIAAVVEGLTAAGVDEIWVLDGHGGGNNFLPQYMVSGAKYVTGVNRGNPCYGLDASFDGFMLVGYHAMYGTPDGLLSHTQSSQNDARYWYDDIERGEIYQGAVIAGHFDVPLMMVTGDQAVCRESEHTFGPEVTTVAVKEGIHREAGVLLAPEDARQLLVAGTKKALAFLPKLRPYKIKLPTTLRIQRRRDHGLEEETHSVTSALQIISGSD